MDLVHGTGNAVWVASRFMWHLLWWSGTLREIVTWSCGPWSGGLEGFPGSSVVKNALANAADTGLIPDPGRSHVLTVEELSPCTTTTEPVLQKLGATTTEASALELVLSNKKSPHTTTREQLSLAATREKFAQQ